MKSCRAITIPALEIRPCWRPARALFILTPAATVACNRGPAPDQTADTLYTGGDIVTVNDAQPSAEPWP